MSSIQFWICDDFYQLLTYLFTFSRTVENIASWPWTFYRTRSSTGFWISPRLVPSRSLESPAERQVIDCFCVDANVLLVSCLFHACFMLVSCLFHACTCGKGPEALLTHDSYLSKSEELLLNIGQRRLKPWNNVILFMRTYMTCRISANVKWNWFQGRNIACTLACNRQGWDAGNSLFNFMKALEVVYRCPTEKLFEIFQPDKKGGTTSGTDGEVYRAKEKVY